MTDVVRLTDPEVEMERRHTAGDVESVAVYSRCESYRYALTRVWAPARPRVGYIMLNPSRATERQNDPTIERCQRRAARMGFGAFRACNLFAFRATDPRDLRRAEVPEGASNDAAILACAAWADVLIAAWGVHGVHRDRGARVMAMLRAAGAELHHFGLTRDGHPRHPLYLPYDRHPVAWSDELTLRAAQPGDAALAGNEHG